MCQCEPSAWSHKLTWFVKARQAARSLMRLQECILLTPGWSADGTALADDGTAPADCCLMEFEAAGFTAAVGCCTDDADDDDVGSRYLGGASVCLSMGMSLRATPLMSKLR